MSHEVMNVKSTTSVKDDVVWKDAANYDFIRFALCDVHGVSRSKLIPRLHVHEKLKTGIGMCAGISVKALFQCFVSVYL